MCAYSWWARGCGNDLGCIWVVLRGCSGWGQPPVTGAKPGFSARAGRGHMRIGWLLDRRPMRTHTPHIPPAPRTPFAPTLQDQDRHDSLRKKSYKVGGGGGAREASAGGWRDGAAQDGASQGSAGQGRTRYGTAGRGWCNGRSKGPLGRGGRLAYKDRARAPHVHAFGAVGPLARHGYPTLHCCTRTGCTHQVMHFHAPGPASLTTAACPAHLQHCPFPPTQVTHLHRPAHACTCCRFRTLGRPGFTPASMPGAHPRPHAPRAGPVP